MPRLAQALKKITRRFGDNNEITFQPRGKAGVVRSISGTMMVIFGNFKFLAATVLHSVTHQLQKS